MRPVLAECVHLRGVSASFASFFSRGQQTGSPDHRENEKKKLPEENLDFTNNYSE